MFLIVHASMGAAIGERLEPPIISFLGGFLSHFIMDMIPHGDERSGRELYRPERRYLLVILAVIDGLSALSLVTMLFLGGFFNNAIGAMAGAAGAIMPDALVGISEIFYGKAWSWLTPPENAQTEGSNAINAIGGDSLSMVRDFQTWFNRFHDWNHRIINIELPMPIGAVIQLATLSISLSLSGFVIF